MTLRRKTYPGNAQLTELAADLAAEFAKLVPMRLVELAEVYAEPMYIEHPRKPAGVMLLDFREDATPETANLFSAGVNWSFTDKGIRIDELNGPILGTRYRYCFLVIG